MTWIKTEGGDFINPDSGVTMGVASRNSITKGLRIERVDAAGMRKMTIRSGFLDADDAQRALDDLMYNHLDAVDVQGPSTEEEMYPGTDDTYAGLADPEPKYTDPDSIPEQQK